MMEHSVCGMEPHVSQQDAALAAKRVAIAATAAAAAAAAAANAPA